MTLQEVVDALKMQNQIAEVQHMCQVCIQAQNDCKHFPSLQALEGAVKSNEFAIAIFLTFRETHPLQCSTIDHY